MDTKMCNKCDLDKELSRFNGRSLTCRDCINKQRREKRAIQPKKEKSNFIQCNICSIIKNKSEFSGRSKLCKICTNIKRQQDRSENPEKYRNMEQNWRNINPEKTKIKEHNAYEVRKLKNDE